MLVPVMFSGYTTIDADIVFYTPNATYVVVDHEEVVEDFSEGDCFLTSWVMLLNLGRKQSTKWVSPPQSKEGIALLQQMFTDRSTVVAQGKTHVVERAPSIVDIISDSRSTLDQVQKKRNFARMKNIHQKAK